MKKVTTQEFLKNFPGYCLQTFDDKGKDRSLIAHGKPSKALWGRLDELNKRGAGIFFSPNSFSKGERRKGLCDGINAWFFEIDDKSFEDQWKSIKAAPIHPDVIVQTRKSLHCYYLAVDAEIESFDLVQRGLIQYFGADPACKDVTRVLRVPGFNHNKLDPVEVEVVYYDAKKHSEQEMLEKFPHEIDKKSSFERTVEVVPENLDFWDAASRLDNKVILMKLSGTMMVNYEEFTFRERSSGGEHIDVNGDIADAWIDDRGRIGSNKGGGPTYIQWLQYYGWRKVDIAEWVKKNCKDLLPENTLENEKKDVKSNNNQAEEILEIFKSQEPVLFKDQMEEGYAYVSVDGKKCLMKCESSKFEKYLRHLTWCKKKRVFGNEAMSKVTKLIAAEAEYGERQYRLFNRVGRYKGCFWYDLGNGRAIQCGKEGWEVVKDIPILFKPFQHQNNQTEPSIIGSDIGLVFKHIRIQQEGHQILFLVWLVAAFVPGIPHPILALHGEKGASKSTTMRLARSLIDPSKTCLLTLPAPSELVQQLAHHYFPCFDNVNRVSESVSDALCRAVTGAGSAKRKLFTDDDDIIYNFRRVIAINGINNVVQKADLLDRSILIELVRVPKVERKTERALDKAFVVDKPVILGGIFSVLSKAMGLIEGIDLKEFPRMADFAEWGCAIAKALGYEQEDFLEAYDENIGQQNEEVIENDPVALTISLLMEKEKEWIGSPSELFEKLKELAENAKVDPKSMPKSVSVMGRAINVVLSNLLEAGIHLTKEKDGVHGRGRMYILTKQGNDDASVADDVVGVGTVVDDRDVSDGCDVKPGVQDFIDGKAVIGDLSPDDQVRVVKKTFDIDNQG